MIEDRKKFVLFTQNLLKKAMQEGAKAGFDSQDLCQALTEALIIFSLENKSTTDEEVLDEIPRAVSKVCYNFKKVLQRKNDKLFII